MDKFGLMLGSGLLLLLGPMGLSAAEEEPLSADAAVADEIMQDDHPSEAKTNDISKEKSDAILAFTGYMLESDPAIRIRHLLKAIDCDPAATVPLGCFIREIEKSPDRSKYEDELVAVALRHPGQLRLNMAAAYLMSAANRHQRVIEIFDHAIADLNINKLPDKELPYFLNLVSIVGKAYLIEKQYETGIAVFRDLLQQSRLQDNLKLLGYAALFYTAAAEKGSEQTGWFHESVRQQAERLRRQCLDRIERNSFQHFTDPAELMLPLDLCKQNNEPRRGADLIYSLLLSKPHDLKTKLFLAVFYTTVGRHLEAYRVWREIVRSEPTNFKFSLELAKTAERAGRFQVAAAAYRNYLRGMPRDTKVINRLAMVELRAGDYQAAFDTAIRAAENPLNCYIAALACRQLKQYRQSAEWLSRMIVSARKAKADNMLDKDFYLMLAYNWERCGEIEKSEDALREVLARYPDDPNANNLLGYMWAARGLKLGPAQHHIERALRREPENPAINDSMAWVLYRTRNYAGAEKYIDKSLKTSGKLPDAVILVHAGDIYFALGRNDVAKRCWEKALRIYSPDEEVDRKELQHKIDRLTLAVKNVK